MAFKLVSIRNDGTANFVADTSADVQDLPTDCLAGSTCTVVGDGSGMEAYMMNNQKQWKKI